MFRHCYESAVMPPDGGKAMNVFGMKMLPRHKGAVLSIGSGGWHITKTSPPMQFDGFFHAARIGC